ncbi:hypothetical protein [Nonomuraea sp. GTA35]|uniref:hypothetical protein n=1 Tax=Nonomuraea sp. GTA35 TaxID=1676746 RepID=UPI0035C0512E
MTASRILAGGRPDRAWGRRLATLTRPAVLVLVLLDDFDMRELTAPQADDLYGLITMTQAELPPGQESLANRETSDKETDKTSRTWGIT